MKNIIALAALFIVLFSSCKKDQDLITTTTQTEDPTLLEDIELRISVKNHEGEPIPNIEIDLYDGETTFQTGLFTNNLGILEYSVCSCFLNTTEIVAVAYHEDYSNGYKKINVSNGNDNDVEIKLVNNSLIPFDSGTSTILNLGSIISLSGYAKDFNGNPLSAVVGIVDDFDYPTFETSAITDSNGYYEIIIPANTDLYLFSFQLDTDCFELINASDIDISWFTADIIEASTTDIVLDDMIGSNGIIPSSVSLTAVDCNNMPIPNAIVTFDVNLLDPYFTFVVTADANGNINHSFDDLTCFNTLDFQIYNPSTGLSSEEISVEFNDNAPLNLGQIAVCTNASANSFQFDIDSGMYSGVTNNVSVIADGINAYSITAIPLDNPDLQFILNIEFDAQNNATGIIAVFENYEISNFGTLEFLSVELTSTTLTGEFLTDLLDPNDGTFEVDMLGSFQVEL